MNPDATNAVRPLDRLIERLRAKQIYVTDVDRETGIVWVNFRGVPISVWQSEDGYLSCFTELLTHYGGNALDVVKREVDALNREWRNPHYDLKGT